MQAHTITTIPLSQLVASPFNVRKRKSDNVDSLAANIAVQGLIHNLVAHPIASRRKQYGVADGERRLSALQLLRTKGKIPATFAVPCKVISEDEAIAVSLSANVEREDMHPADVYESMRALVDAGQSVERIAAAFNVTPIVVSRRLKLANVAPMFMELFRKDEIDLECMMALALTDDHDQQVKIWNDLPKQRRNAWSIRELLTESEIDAKRNPIAKYVGLKTYQKAGGPVRFDLFSDEGEGFLQDGALLQRLAQEKLDRKKAHIEKDGWAWVEAHIEFTHADQLKFGRVRNVTRTPTKKEAQSMDELRAEIVALETRDDLSEDEQEAFFDKQDALDEIEESLTVPDPDAKSYAGAVVTIDNNGNAQVITGLVRPEDRKRLEKERKDAATKEGACSPIDDGSNGEAQEASSEYSDKLTRNLTAHFTAALQCSVAQRPQVALAATVFALLPKVLAVSRGDLIRLHSEYFSLSTHAPTIDTFGPSMALADQLTELRSCVPEEGLLQWLLDRTTDELLQMLAVCTALSLNAVSGSVLSDDAQSLARAASLNMAESWSATGQSFLAHVPKKTIVEAVREARSPELAAPIEQMKKADAVNAAEEILKGSGWLPKVLRI